jgi:FtsZ-interacting cell division protein ZipA
VSTAIIVIIAIAIIALIAFMFIMPRARAKARERELESRRSEVADTHRDHAQQRVAKAEVAEHEAARERAEAELHETRARMHEKGLADDELDTDRERLTEGGNLRGRDERFSTDEREHPTARDEEPATHDERDATVPPEERRR